MTILAIAFFVAMTGFTFAAWDVAKMFIHERRYRYQALERELTDRLMTATIIVKEVKESSEELSKRMEETDRRLTSMESIVRSESISRVMKR